MTSQGHHQQRRRPPWWKRQYLVNRDLQVRYARSGVIIGIMSSVVSAGMLLWSFWSFNIWQGQRLPPPVLVVIVVVLVTNVFGIFVASVVATQRIAGPLFNLLRQFQKLAAGDFSAQARFRDGDDIHYVGRRFNEMVERLSERDSRIFAKVEEALAALDEGHGERAKQALGEVRGLRAAREPKTKD